MTLKKYWSPSLWPTEKSWSPLDHPKKIFGPPSQTDSPPLPLKNDSSLINTPTPNILRIKFHDTPFAYHRVSFKERLTLNGHPKHVIKGLTEMQVCRSAYLITNAFLEISSNVYQYQHASSEQNCFQNFEVNLVVSIIPSTSFMGICKSGF